MWINGINYYLTRHGRRRFVERLGEMADSDMIATAVYGVPGFQFIWKPDWNNPKWAKRLVTVKKDEGDWQDNMFVYKPGGDNVSKSELSRQHYSRAGLSGPSYEEAENRDQGQTIGEQSNN